MLCVSYQAKLLNTIANIIDRHEHTIDLHALAPVIWINHKQSIVGLYKVLTFVINDIHNSI